MQQNKIFTIYNSELFFDTIAYHVFHQDYLNAWVILPTKEDVIEFNQVFSNTYQDKVGNVTALTDIDSCQLISNTKTTEVLSATRRLLLLKQFIYNYNLSFNESYPLSLSYDLSSLLNSLYMNQVPLKSLYELRQEDYAKHWQKTGEFLFEFARQWQNILKNEGCIDILEHKLIYINDLIARWEEDKPSYPIIFVGISINKIHLNLMNAIYNLPNGQLIIPHVNKNISEQDWCNLESGHYQYCVKYLLDKLSVTRNQVKSLDQNNSTFIEKLFNFELYIKEFYKNRYLDKENIATNIKVIECDTEEQEIDVILSIKRQIGSASVMFFSENNTLVKKIQALTLTDIDYVNQDYLVATLLLYVLKVVITNGDIIEVMSLLKHPLVNLKFECLEYQCYVQSFEMIIVRNYCGNNFKNIYHNISQLCPDLLLFWERFESSLLPLREIDSYDVHNILLAHLKCIDNLTLDSVSMSEAMQEFISNFQNSCSNFKVLELTTYYDIMKSFLHSNFLNINNKVSEFTLKVPQYVIFSGFTADIYPPNFYNPWLNNNMCSSIGVSTSKECSGYFLYILYNLFQAKKVFITFTKKGYNKINEEALLLKYFALLLKLYNQDIDWKYRNNNSYCTITTTPTVQSKSPPNPPYEARVKAFSNLSPTAIEMLISNPYAFYVKYILNLNPIKEINERPNIKDFGIIIHKVLQKYTILTSSSRNDSYQILIDLANLEFSKFYYDYSYVKSIWWPKFEVIAKHFIELDQQRRYKTNIIKAEQSFSWQILENVKITAKCDRVEYFDNDKIAIIDYKTGNVPAYKNSFLSQIIIQALTAKYFLGASIEELMYWKIGTEEIKITNIKNINDVLEKAEKNLKDLLNIYLNDNMPFHFTSVCEMRYNDVKLLARVSGE